MIAPAFRRLKAARFPLGIETKTMGDLGFPLLRLKAARFPLGIETDDHPLPEPEKDPAKGCSLPVGD